MSEPRRTPGRFAWLLPLAFFVLVLSLMPSENQRPRKLPFPPDSPASPRWSRPS
jgi:hypothetical protein